MRRAAFALIFGVLAVAPVAVSTTDPFEFFRPTVVVAAGDLARLASGGVLARVLPAAPGELALFAAVPVAIDAARFEAWVHDIAAFKRGATVLSIGRFSDPPALADLEGLSFPDTDLEDLRNCQSSDCGLKLTPTEIEQLKQWAGVDRSPAGLQRALRRLVLQRVQTYLAHGHCASAAHDGESAPGRSESPFSHLLFQSPFLTERLPQLCSVVERWPSASGGTGRDLRTFVYWSQENYGGKPIVSATHVFIRRAPDVRDGSPEVLVLGKQIFATHYIDGWLGVTALVRDGTNGRAYLVYVNRSRVDVLKGFWGSVIRRILQKRLKAEAPAVLYGIQRRLESGAPRGTL